jgi:hypothetical protein
MGVVPSGLDVASPSWLIDKVLASGLSSVKQRTFLGDLLLLSQGREVQMLPGSREELRNQLRTLEVALDGSSIFGQKVASAWSLDFLTGTQVRMP